jgi:adenylate kinase
LNLLLFGPPGCGKGTQSARITRWLDIPGISTGEMLREEVAAGSDLGREITSILSAGGLVDDDLVNRILTHRISLPDCKNGFLLDGYPRTVSQARFLEKTLDSLGIGPPLVLHLDVPLGVLKRRISARRQCPKCNRIYNLLKDPPIKKQKCNDDGELLIRRRDDHPSVVSSRLEAYKSWTHPVLEFYQTGNYHRVDGDLPPGEVFAQIEPVLEGRMTRALR